MNVQKASLTAVWDPNSCLQCSICAYVCPTGALIPTIQTPEHALKGLIALREDPALRYSIMVSAADCTGCGLCVSECPAKGKALTLRERSDIQKSAEVQLVRVPFPKHSLKGSQFERANADFHSACPGCAQAIYLKLLTQLFGSRMVAAGAYGCTDVVLDFAGAAGQGGGNQQKPLEQVRAIFAQREELKDHVRQLYNAVGISARAWVEESADAEKTGTIAEILRNRCAKLADRNEHTKYVLEHAALLEKPSVWVLGGDGISDIGEQEKRTLLQSGLNINLLLFETGDAAGSRQAVFAKEMQNNGDIFVAQIAVGADYKQTLLALQAAERFEGPSLIVAYAPCVGEQVASDGALEVMRAAVHTGVWQIFMPASESEAVGAWTEYQPKRHKGVEQWAAVSREKNKHPMDEQDPSLRINNFEEVYRSYSPAQAIREAKRCLRCQERPCMKLGCPVHNRIPDFIEQVAKGNFEGAYQILSETTCLPAVCGRVCQQSKQCEGNCVRGNKGQPVAIGNLERFVADWHRAHIEQKSTAPEANGYQVAVIGSGPSGVACAGDLADLGYSVTVYEKTQMLGGVLSCGIPEFRLPKEIVRHEIEKLKGKGVRFLTGMELGKNVDANDLLQSGYDAVYLANGAGIPLRMNIPGENAKGVYSASDYLMRINGNGPDEASELSAARRVAVVGGGNVAMDACRAAVRMGAEIVYVLYRRSQAEMPADPVELREAQEEGVQFRFLTNPVRILSDGAVVCGVECVAMELGEPDSSGRRSVKAMDGSEFVLDVDCVIMALGTSFDRTAVQSVSGLAVTEKGAILVGDDHAVNLSGMFAGGDAVTGSASVIRAMGAGKTAARSIHSAIQEKHSKEF